MTLSTGPVPTSQTVTELEERFVMTAHHNRMLLKKLRHVKAEAYYSTRARNIAAALLDGNPVLDPIDGAEPLTADEMTRAAEIIADYHLLRQTLAHGQALHDASRKGEVERVKKLLQSRPAAVGLSLGGSISETSSKYLAQITTGTSFKQFDAPLSTRFPLEKGAIHTIAAGPGGGKSAWSECLAWELSSKGERVLDLSAELTEIPKFARYAQHLRGPGVGLSAYVNGTVDTRALGEAIRQINANRNLKLSTGLSSIWDIKDAIRHHVAESGVRVVIVDFLQIIRVPGVANKYEALEIITGELKELGDELGIAQLWLSQLSRAGRTGVTRPTMEHAEGSGRIEQLSWSVAVLDAKEAMPGAQSREVTVYFDKSRYGGIGPVKARFAGAHYDFYLEGQKPLAERVGATASLAHV